MDTTKTDISILYAWAGLPETIQAGYKNVAYNDGGRISARQAKKRVHDALERFGYDPHTSHKLIQAWLYWKKYFEKHGGEIT